MSRYILGISCFFHDSAACLIKDGVIIAAAQEERFTRIKHDPSFPLFAINYCLEEAGINEEDISCIAFYENASLALDRIAFEMARQPLSVSEQQFQKLIKGWGTGKFTPETAIRLHLPGFKGEIKSVEHHHAHAAAAFYPSPFDEAAILTMDGVGEWATSSIAHGKGHDITLLKQMNYPDSLGLFYSAATYYLGFKVNSGEYKVMGLAPYGTPKYVDLLRGSVIHVHEDGSLRLNPAFFDLSGINAMATRKWDELFAAPRRSSESALEEFHMDVAASIQVITEKTMIAMARHAKALTGAKYLVLSGGVALNCVGNGKILRENIFDDIWIQPSAGDAGNALGAAMAIWHTETKGPYTSKNNQDLMNGGRLGPAYNESEITDFLELYDFPYIKLSDANMAAKVTDLIEAGKIIGLFAGRMEFGPRALGGRSIIGDARQPEMQERMNLKIKFRESFRPFAPVVREENVSEWFELDRASPYMLLVAPVAKDKRLALDGAHNDIRNRLKQKRSQVSAITHVDFSARVQTVPKNPDTALRRILDEFYKRTDVPILINTSFNLRSEPIVTTPMDAYRCMMRSHIDAILLENILVLREQQPAWEEEGDWRDQFEAD